MEFVFHDYVGKIYALWAGSWRCIGLRVEAGAFVFESFYVFKMRGSALFGLDRGITEIFLGGGGDS